MFKTKTFPAPAAFATGPRPQIPLVPVTSNQVKAIGYDAATKTLAVTFTRGLASIYHYPNVEPDAHAAFVAAESIGRHFGEHIKHLPFDKYPAEQTVEEAAETARACIAEAREAKSLPEPLLGAISDVVDALAPQATQP